MSDEMEETVERPRIKQVFVIGSDEPVPASRYLETDRRAFAEIRLEHETAILINNPIARCAACHRPVKPRRHYKYNRRYFKHHESDGECPYKTSGPASQRQIDAMRYNGQKEGPDHIRLKGLLVSSIESDITFDHIRIEERWWGVTNEEKWKKPDVAADHLGLPVAFEIQLSTTFLNVMADRRKFYQEYGAILVWIFKDVHKEESRQFQDDIFYNNNSNIFVVDEETARVSDENIELTLRCHYLKPVLQGSQIVEEWQEELVSFSELTIDQEKQRIYFFDFAEADKRLKRDLQEAADADLRERFLDYWSALGLYASGTAGITGEWPTKWNKMVADFIKCGISELFHRYSPSIFARLQRPEALSCPSVFISYASADRERVNKIDQWLRDNGLRVVRDCQFFIAGTTIQENIIRAMAHSDKILAVLSNSSRDRDWPRFERELAEQVEAKLGAPVLIYLCLDSATLSAHDSTRLAIHTQGKTLKQVGEEVLHAVAGVPIPQWQYAYDENEPL